MQIRRDWATPLTIGAFLLSAVTGILLFFHLDTGLNKAAHEWLGWAMVAGVALHAAANWNAFRRHLGSRAGRALVGGFALLTALSFLPAAGGGESPARLTMGAVAQAPLAALAPLAGKDSTRLLLQLREAGFPAHDAQQSLASLTGGDREAQGRALAVVFAKR